MASTTKAFAADFQITGVLDMQQNEVTNLETDLAVYPTEVDQGATKIYVDAVKEDILTELLSVVVDNGSF